MSWQVGGGSEAVTHTHESNFESDLRKVEQENHIKWFYQIKTSQKKKKTREDVRNVRGISHSTTLKTAPDVVSSVSAGEECVSAVLLSFPSVGSEELWPAARMAGEAGESGSSAVGEKKLILLYYNDWTIQKYLFKCSKKTSKYLPLLQEDIQVVTVSMFKFSSQGFSVLL